MYEIFNDIEIYSPEDVLNPFFLLIHNDFPKSYYQYFKKINKPDNIISITGIEIELPKSMNIQSCLEKLSPETIDILQINMNRPLKINNNTYFFTLFNCLEENLVNKLMISLEKIEIEKLIIGIFICHPLTIVNEFILNTDNQLNNAKKINCMISLLNLLDS